MTGAVFNRVLVGWDGSPGAVAGLQLASRLMAGSGGEVTALAVVPDYSHLEDHEQRSRAVELVRGPLQEMFDRVSGASRHPDGWQPTLEFVEASDVARVFDGYARTHPIDLVIVGLHGREGLLHPKMGHVASHAVRAGLCPVLVMPDPDQTPPDESGSRIGTLFHPFRHRERSA